jgi:methyltransferase family protein
VVPSGDERVRQLVDSGDRGAWINAAVALALDSGSPEAQRVAAVELLRALDIDVDADLGELDRRAVGAQAAAPLLQTAAVVGGGDLWEGQSDEALLAQGRASAQGAAAMVRFGLPMLGGLAEALARPGAKMLDVGTGVAAMAVAYAELFPELTVVGLDVLPRALSLAAATVAASGVADRVVLREQDVAGLDEEATYALAWLPAPFLPEAALRAGTPRVARAMAPGGWVVLGHGKFAEAPVDNAVTRFKTVAYGGTALDDEQAQLLLREAGLQDVTTAPTPPGAPALTVGRKTS